MKRNNDIKKVLTPIDFSENASLVAESAAYVAGTFKASLVLVFVVQNFEDYSGFFVPEMSMPNVEQQLFVAAQERMEEFRKEHEDTFKAAGVNSVSCKVIAGEVAERIVDYADEQGVDLIVMGTHGYKGLEKIMFGSVADKVVKSISCPIMTINPYKCCEE